MSDLSNFVDNVSLMAAAIGEDVKELRTLIGTNGDPLALGDLTTTEKSNLIAAINELVANKINSIEKGAVNGIAELGADGKVLTTQLPSYVDDILEGYLSGGQFYEEDSYTTLISPESGKIYIDASDNQVYRWSGSMYVEISSSLSLGITASTAYRGDLGNIAYNHSQDTSTPNPHNVAFDDLNAKPTTIAGYGITDSYDSSDFNADLATKTSDNVTEGTTNKYYTDARVESKVSKGYVEGLGIDASSLSGTLADARLSSLVSLKNTENTFTKSQVIHHDSVLTNAFLRIVGFLSENRFSYVDLETAGGSWILSNGLGNQINNSDFYIQRGDSQPRLKLSRGTNNLILYDTSYNAGTTISANGNSVFNGGIEASSIKLTTGASNGYYLKSDASGNGTWAPLSASQVYKGTWNATTNTPSLSNGTGTDGDYYRCVVAGTVDFGAGNITFAVGDDVSYNGSIWEKIPGQGYTLQTATDSVLGGVKIGDGISISSGVITPDFGTTADTVAEGNDSRIINGQTAYDWGDWSEGVGKAYVDNLNINAATLDNLDSTDFVKKTDDTDSLTEGNTNLYFTNARAVSAIDTVVGSTNPLTSYSTALNS